ncbi:MAG TPA: glycosyltransferase family 2 protein [Casimicrobiaceae bacterium]
MKLVIQIPCLDESQTLPATIKDLPTALPGIDDIRVIVVDDGSDDGTADVAASLDAAVVRFPTTRGLAAAFSTGVEAALLLDADIIVNTDGDNQYRGGDVALLIAPIVAGRADIVIGARPIATMREFSWIKKVLQRAGSWVVRRLSGTTIVDATSGFRAYSREAALRLEVFSGYTYTLETIVQGANCGLRIASVPVGVNAVVRKSRLMRGSAHYVMRAGTGLVRMFVVYRPFRFFIIPGAAAIAIAMLIGLRFLWLFVESGGAAGHLQSLLLSAILFGLGGALTVVAFLGDLIAINRRMLEDLRLDARRQRFDALRRARRGTDCA